jgi:hypothetical protein
MEMPIDVDGGFRAQAANAENDEKRLDGFHSPSSEGECRVSATSLEHDPEKWKPVFRKDHAQTKR